MSTVPAATPTDSNSNVSTQSSGTSTAVAVGVSVGLLVFLGLSLLGYFYLYRPYRRKRQQDLESRRRETVVEPGHMASRVTPFYPFRGEGPRFGEFVLPNPLKSSSHCLQSIHLVKACASPIVVKTADGNSSLRRPPL